MKSIWMIKDHHEWVSGKVLILKNIGEIEQTRGGGGQISNLVESTHWRTN